MGEVCGKRHFRNAGNENDKKNTKSRLEPEFSRGEVEPDPELARKSPVSCTSFPRILLVAKGPCFQMLVAKGPSFQLSRLLAGVFVVVVVVDIPLSQCFWPRAASTLTSALVLLLLNTLVSLVTDGATGASLRGET